MKKQISLYGSLSYKHTIHYSIDDIKSLCGRNIEDNDRYNFIPEGDFSKAFIVRHECKTCSKKLKFI